MTREHVNYKPVVYISGPYSSNPVGNTQIACEVWKELFEADEVIPICPHWSHVQEKATPELAYEDYMTYDLEVIGNFVDAVIRIPGPSAGADRETDFAQAKGMPVFNYPDGMVALNEWAEANRHHRSIS